MFGSALRRRETLRFRAVVRFSIFDPDWGGWRATNSGTFHRPEDYRDYLWSAERIRPRMRIFGQVALPIHQLLAERYDYAVLVQHSPNLPSEWLDALRGLTHDYPVLRLVPVQGWVEARDTVAEDLAGERRSGPVVMMRLDDDDVLSADFLDQLLPYVTPAHHGWCVSLGAGLAARLEGEELVDFRSLTQPFNSVGQAYVGGYRGTQLELPTMPPHRHVHRSMPTVVDSSSVAFIQVRHASQDSHVGHDPDAAQRLMLRKFAALPRVPDLAKLGARFPSLADTFERLEQAQSTE